jgi:hypothetical protein
MQTAGNSAKSRAIPSEKTPVGLPKKAAVIIVADEGANPETTLQSRSIAGNIVKTQRIKTKLLKPVMMGKEGKKKKDKAGGKAAKKLKTNAAEETEKGSDPIGLAGAAAE